MFILCTSSELILITFFFTVGSVHLSDYKQQQEVSEQDCFEHGGFSYVSVQYGKRKSFFCDCGWEGAPAQPEYLRGCQHQAMPFCWSHTGTGNKHRKCQPQKPFKYKRNLPQVWRRSQKEKKKSMLKSYYKPILLEDETKQTFALQLDFLLLCQDWCKNKTSNYQLGSKTSSAAQWAPPCIFRRGAWGEMEGEHIITLN